MSIKFPFKERKAAQAAAHLLVRRGGSHNYMALIKLLYLADRQALIEAGKPITGDRPFSLPHGTVLSRILELINTGEESEINPWFEYISDAQNYEVGLAIETPDSEELSEYELGVLNDIDSKFGHLNQWQLRKLTHKLPEWVDPEGSSIPIRIETILESANKSEQEIKRIAGNANEASFFKTLEE